MKKSDELMLYAPKPQRPVLDVKLCMSVAAGQGSGQYINGRVLTVAVWDRCKEPLAVWRFFGDYWIGRLRKKDSPKPSELRPSHIDIGNGRMLIHAESVAATEQESNLLQDYFNDKRPGHLVQIVDSALYAHRRSLLNQRDRKQKMETERMFDKLPNLPSDFERRILAECSECVFLWVTDAKVKRILPCGVVDMVKVQRVRCDSCGGQYTVDGRELKQKETTICQCCKKQMTVYNTKYPAKRVYKARTFLLSQPAKGSVWLRKFFVGFTFKDHCAKVEIFERAIWWTDGQAVKQWNSCCYYPDYKRKWAMIQRPKLTTALSAPAGYYQPYELVAHEPQLEKDVRKVLKSGWLYRYDKRLNFYWEIKLWQAVRSYPMAESLIKTGWVDALSQYIDGELGYHCPNINMRSKSYYGVFGLNRTELEISLTSTKGNKSSFNYINDIVGWKKAGLAITPNNVKMVSNIYSVQTAQKAFGHYGMNSSLKYLRQQTRRITGKYDGHIDANVTSDWLDYIDMAKRSGMDLSIDKVLFPLDLKRRHAEMVTERHKIGREEAVKSELKAIDSEASALDTTYKIPDIYRKIRKIYEYDGAEYIVRVPESAKDILQESVFLDHCVRRGTRYFERIANRESYIFFLRRRSDPNTPWYTLEVEPGGTVRQKRSYNNDQYADLDDAKPFINEWQQVVQQRMNDVEINLANRAKEIRTQEFEELRKNGNVIRTGAQAGKLLVDELMADLMEVQKNAG